MIILNRQNKDKASQFFRDALEVGLQFKLQSNVRLKKLTETAKNKILSPLPRTGCSLDSILKEFKKSLLPYCVNPASPTFLGFPYTGNAISALGGAILENFIQQNLMNFDWSPSATITEIAVIRWLRELMGYSVTDQISDIKEVGGIVTPGGIMSNTIAMLLAREYVAPGTMKQGITNPSRFHVLVPKGIAHYSIAAALEWSGCGDRIIEVNTKENFKMDIKDLEKKLIYFHEKIMAVVAFAGDSKTMTVDNLLNVANTVRLIDGKVWLHADACHGFCLAFSPLLKKKLAGIEMYDSIAADPHKTLGVPYGLSFLLLKDPQRLLLLSTLSSKNKNLSSMSLGSTTPFLGTKPWMSLRLWFLLKQMGVEGIGKTVERNHRLAKFFASRLKQDTEFLVLNSVDFNAVIFYYLGHQPDKNIERLNNISSKICAALEMRGKYSFHQSRVVDPGILKKGAILKPLRFMCGNPNTSRQDVLRSIQVIKRIGKRLSVNNS